MSDEGNPPLVQREITSPLLNVPRKIWYQRDSSGKATTCLVFLDAELYIERVRAPRIVATEQLEERLPHVNCVYVSSVSAAARHTDYTCNSAYAGFLATDLITWCERSVQIHSHYVLCGLSLSGLQATFTCLQHSRVFRGVLCQSPSAWWNGERLAQQVTAPLSPSPRFWLSVGLEELQHGVSHAPSGLYQGVSQLDSCRRLAAALRTAGHEIRTNEYAGGHDPKCWGDELPVALRYLLNDA